MSSVALRIASTDTVHWSPKRLMASEKRRHRCAITGRILAAKDSVSLGLRVKVRSNASSVFVDLSTISGVDRRVSIRTTSATSPTRAQDTAASGRSRTRKRLLRS
jgi:hypothetical protein